MHSFQIPILPSGLRAVFSPKKNQRKIKPKRKSKNKRNTQKREGDPEEESNNYTFSFYYISFNLLSFPIPLSKLTLSRMVHPGLGISLYRSIEGFQITWVVSEPELHSNDGTSGASSHNNQASGSRLCTQAPSPSLNHHHTILTSLSSYLSMKMCRSIDSRSRSFLPRSQLATLAESFQIFEGARRTLAVLILLDKLAYVTVFISEGFKDSWLPVRKIDFQEDRPCFTKRTNSTIMAFKRCFKDWAAKDIEAFMETQWMALSPFFEKSANDISLYDFDSDAILPFMEDELDGTSPRRAGGYGIVRRVKIHSSHHDFDQEQVCYRKLIHFY